jgi:hypothetical protein
MMSDERSEGRMVARFPRAARGAAPLTVKP